jgi:hypothetical protein
MQQVCLGSFREVAHCTAHRDFCAVDQELARGAGAMRLACGEGGRGGQAKTESEEGLSRETHV